MKTDIESRLRLFFLGIAFIVMTLGLYTFSYREIYESIDVDTVKVPVIEYGSANYDFSQLINNVDGKLISVKKNIETNEVGVQELILVVSKGNVSREIPISIEVKDSLFPIVVLRNDVLEIEQGTKYDLLDNIEEVYDDVDGGINYVEYNDVTDELVNYYTVYSDINYNVPGEYTVNIRAVDKNGNVLNTNYKIIVKERALGVAVTNLAYSLLGSSYVAGGRGPYSFDCSGFVQYVYATFGVSVSRSTSTQMYDGSAIEYSDILPGDIINWGYSDGTSTHSAIYVGDGKMIHAANPSFGVILSDVSYWEGHSGTQILGVRRI